MTRDRTGRGRLGARRGVAMMGLLAAALVALVVAPAPSATAGRNSSAIKVHNLTKDATFIVSDVIVTNAISRPYWEEHGTPKYGDQVPPGHQTHYELITQPDQHLSAQVDFTIWNAAGERVGKLFTTTYVDGKSYWWNYGKAHNTCRTEGPFTCDPNGTDTVTVRDRNYFEFENRSSTETFAIDQVGVTTTFESGTWDSGTRLERGAVLRGSLNATPGKVTGAVFYWNAYNPAGARNGWVAVTVNVEPDGRITSQCGTRSGGFFKCWDDGKGHVYFLDLSVRTPLHEP